MAPARRRSRRPSASWLQSDIELDELPDSLQRFLLRDAAVRGEIVSLDTAWGEIVRRHDLPTNVRDYLGQLSAAALLLCATLKFDGKLILQIHGDGPVALLVVECDASGSFRSTVKIREGAAVPPDARLGDLVNAHGRGRFVVTLDPRSRNPEQAPYQGIVPFEGDTVAAVLERYMARSEQVPTRLWLAADGRRATGLLLQRLPDEGGNRGSELPRDEDGWTRMSLLAGTLGPDELLSLPSDKVLDRLFWQEPLQGFDTRGCRFACTCNRDKVGGMLRILGREEVVSILAERDAIDVHCDFCNEPYRFDAVDATYLFTAGPLSPSTDTRQ
jgi:molecular chaperone Hsp33